MYRKLMTIATVAVFLCSGIIIVKDAACQEPAAGQKFGYVDLLKVFDSYGKTKEFEKSLEQKEKEKTDERKKMVDDVRKLKDELELLADKAKADKQTAIDGKIKDLQNFDMVTREELTKQRDDMLRDLLKEIDGIVAEFAKKEKYTFIFNSRFLIYGDQSIDLTDKIIEILNNKK